MKRPASAARQDIERRFARGLAAHRAGDLDAAEGFYRRVLHDAPRHANALHFLGVIAHQRGRSSAAIELIGRSLAINPNLAAAHANLGNALLQLGRLGDALTSYERAIAIKPDYAEAFYNRGNALLLLDRREAAIESYDRAIALAPRYVDALLNRGRALHDLGRPGEALQSYDRALAIEPDLAAALCGRGDALHDLNRHEDALASYDRGLLRDPANIDALANRGAVLLDLGQHEEALASLARALEIKPDLAETLSNYGAALLAMKRPDEAMASLERAIAIKPELADAHYNRAKVLSGLGRPVEALTSLDRALALKPNFWKAHFNRGNALLTLQRPEEALHSFDAARAGNPQDAAIMSNRGAALLALSRPHDALLSCQDALAIDPDHADALNNAGNALMLLKRCDEAAVVYTRLVEVSPDFDYARGCLLHAQLQGCDWRDYSPAVVRVVADVERERHADLPFPFLAISSSPHQQLTCARLHAAHKFAATAEPVWRGERYDHRRIHIAYLSADFHHHATAYLTARLFELHDRDRFETTALSFGPGFADGMRRRIEAAFERFVDVRTLSDHAVGRLMRDLEIDIAIDLKGYTTNSRPGILAQRAAPVQVGYLGFPGTAGADYIDYILADPIVIPEEHRVCYTENVVWLPGSYQVNDATRSVAAHTPTRAEAGLPETGFVFCCFNNNFKIQPRIFDIWMRLLHQISGSVLWLLADNDAATGNLRREAEARGIGKERLVFAGRVAVEEHLARHRLADLFLDTLPYNAHTTASDALWAGLPLVTCIGSTFAGRVAASLLHAAGLPEMITGTLEEYEALALKLAMNRTALAEIKAKLAHHRGTCPLFDTDRFRRHLETAYETMWMRQRRDMPPAAFTVPDET